LTEIYDKIKYIELIHNGMTSFKLLKQNSHLA